MISMKNLIEKRIRREKRFNKSRRIRACDSKKTFYKFEQAKMKAIKIKRRKGHSLSVYECRFCLKYHLSSDVKMEREKKKKGC